MSFLDRILKASQPDLVTSVVARSSKGMWGSSTIEITSVKDVSNEPSLNTVIAKISSSVADAYNQSDALATAELQFAIYPWGDDIEHIFQISQTQDGFSAHDTQGGDISITGKSLEEIVSLIPRKISNPNTAMLQWIRPVRDLR
jgi:hypothetical protein